MATYRLVLDSSAVSALAEKEDGVFLIVEKALAKGSELVVPSVVVAESTTGHGPRDARVNRILGNLRVAVLDETIARHAGRLRHATRSRRSGTVDAIVMATADQAPGSHLITGDGRDLRALSAVLDTTIVISLDGR